MNDLKYLRVLYVEDDEATREALLKFLKTRVGKVYSASSGEEGLQKFKEFKPNLLIADLIMPGMSGLEMIGEIRKIDRGSRILVTSTVKELETVLEAVDLGIDHYIVKPIDTEELERKMTAAARDIISREEKSHHFNFADLENYGAVEENIRCEFIKILKTSLGRGPQDVKVLLCDNQIELTAIDAVTVMEKTISANRRNISVVEQFRRLLYQEISKKLEDCMKEITGYQAEVKSIDVDGAKRIDKILLTINI